MRFIRNLGGTLVLAWMVSACFNPPEFPDIPSISVNSLEFIDEPNPSAPDSLIVVINFKDGNGDLGLSPDNPADAQYPYNDKFYFRLDGYKFPNATSNGQNIDTADYIHYSDRTLPGLDTLPPYVAPYKCRNWEVFHSNSGLATDTVYQQTNPNHFNFFVDILVQQPDKSFKLFDWATELPDNCDLAGFNGRFPILSKDLGSPAPQEGTIKYSMVSPAWNIFFSIQVLKLRISIQDRNLNRSNVVETKEFQLASI